MLWCCSWYAMLQKYFVITVCVRMNCRIVVLVVSCNTCTSPATSVYSLGGWGYSDCAGCSYKSTRLSTTLEEVCFYAAGRFKTPSKCIHSFCEESQNCGYAIVGQLRSHGLRRKTGIRRCESCSSSATACFVRSWAGRLQCFGNPLMDLF